MDAEVQYFNMVAAALYGVELIFSRTASRCGRTRYLGPVCQAEGTRKGAYGRRKCCEEREAEGRGGQSRKCCQPDAGREAKNGRARERLAPAQAADLRTADLVLNGELCRTRVSCSIRAALFRSWRRA